MKNIIYILIISSFAACQQGNRDQAINSPDRYEHDSVVQDRTEFDHELAARLKADTYGMKTYVLALLKSGPNRNQDSATAAELQTAHLVNIKRLAEAGKLVLAGPFMDDDSIRGIYIFNVSSIEEARELTLSDPAVQSGRLKMELHLWYGSAALQELNGIHNKIQKEEF